MKTPKELKELAAKLSKGWAHYGVVTVDTAWGIGSSDDLQQPQWRLIAYTESPDKIARVLPHIVDGIPVDVKVTPSKFNN